MEKVTGQLEFDIKLTTGDLFRYTMRHTYASFSGVFGLLVSFASLFICIVKFKDFDAPAICALILIALLFTVIQPALLYLKCRKQVKNNKDIKDVLHYTLTEDEIRVEQGDQEAEIYWYQIRKAVYAKTAVYLYMSAVRAFIFPKDGCDGKFEEIKNMVWQGMEKYQDYDPEEDGIEDKAEDDLEADGIEEEEDN